MARVIQTVQPVHTADGQRLFAVRIPGSRDYTETVLVWAMAEEDNGLPLRVLGHLTVHADRGGWTDGSDPIEWIEVHPDFRRKGIGRKLWDTACRALGRTLTHDPATWHGQRFAKAMERQAVGR